MKKVTGKDAVYYPGKAEPPASEPAKKETVKEKAPATKKAAKK